MKKYSRFVMAALLVLPMMAACSGDEVLTEEPSVKESADSRSAGGDGIDHELEKALEIPDSVLATYMPAGVPLTNDLCGLSKTEFDLNNGVQVIEITSEKPFCIDLITIRNWAYFADNDERAAQGIYVDKCEKNKFKENPDIYAESGELDFVSFERDNQCHLRVFLTENNTGGLRDVFINTYDPTHVLWEGYVQPYNYCRIWIKQQAE